MEPFVTIWNFIITYWPNIVQGVTTTKLFADALDYLEKSRTILNDQSISIEDKEWELNTRQKMVKQMVKLTEVEATYNLARAGLFMAFTTAVLYLTLRWMQGVWGLRTKE